MPQFPAAAFRGGGNRGNTGTFVEGPAPRGANHLPLEEWSDVFELNRALGTASSFQRPSLNGVVHLAQVADARVALELTLALAK
jgi:hypothetical protein